MSYYLIGCKYGEGHNIDKLPEMIEKGVISVQRNGNRPPLNNFRKGNRKEIYNRLKERQDSKGDMTPKVTKKGIEYACSILSYLLSFKPHDMLAIKSSGKIVAYARVVERNGVVYHEDQKLGHCVNVEFLQTSLNKSLNGKAFRRTITEIKKEEVDKFFDGLFDEHKIPEELSEKKRETYPEGGKGMSKARLDMSTQTHNSQKKTSSDRRPPLKLSDINIPVGSELTLKEDPSEKCVTLDTNNKVEYGGEEMTLTGAAKAALGKRESVKNTCGVAGSYHWKYKGELLRHIRNRMEIEANKKVPSIRGTQGERRRPAQSRPIEDQIRKPSVGGRAKQEHNKLQENLRKELVAQHGEDKVEMEGNFIDIKLEEKKQITLFEVKIGKPVRCIRDGLGQLLSYAQLLENSEGKKIKLAIVGPDEPSKEEMKFIEFIKKNLSIDFEYQQCF